MNPEEQKKIFDRVLYIGPDCKGMGGIASVLASYSRFFAPFHYLPTNSRNGFVRGILNWAKALALLPIERLRGRKILHIHYATGKSWTRKNTIAVWGRLLGFKTIMHCHAGSITDNPPSGMQSRLSKVSLNIVLSRHWIDIFVNKFGIPHVVAVNNIAEPVAKQNNIPHSPLTFIFIGDILQRKGIMDVIEALPSVVASVAPGSFRVLIAGIGETDKLKQRIADLGLDGIVEYRGWVSGPSKEALFDESDVMLLTSYIEGLPISLLEAMSRGMGIVASPVGGIPEIVKNDLNGFIVTPGNLDEIAEAMTKYISQPQMVKTHGKISLERVRRFYPEAVAESLAAIYKDLLKE